MKSILWSCVQGALIGCGILFLIAMAAVAISPSTPPPVETQTVWHVVEGVRIVRVYTTHDVCYVTLSELGGRASGYTHSTSCLRGQ